MIVRTITPPPGSTISVATDGAIPLIRIRQPSGGAMRYFVAAFMSFWLGGWSIGFYSASSRVLSGHAPPFLIFWLGGWTLGGGFAVWTLYRIFRPAVAETLKLGANGIVYDSGVPPFRRGFRATNRKDAWKSYFPKRTIVTISRQDLRSLRLREAELENRLTVDVANARVDLGRAASEVEREWLYRVLTERYSLPAA
ncbi:MAG: hypothetical protein JO084_20765 [Bradyrhizobiaceae bacterium]|nr:hypothetical protein [Bradyrhizobiaceae bacterium]